MNENDVIQENESKQLGLKLFSFLSKINTQVIAVILIALLTLQVLYGLFEPVYSQTELVALFYGKSLIIRLLGYLGIGNWLIDFYCRVYIHRKKLMKWTFLKRPWTGLLALLLIWAFFAIAIARDRRLAFFGGAYRYEGFLSYLAYAGIFLNASIIKNEKYRKIIFIFITAVSTALASLTLIKELLGANFLMFRGRLVLAYSATFVNSNHYGYYLCVSMAVIAGLFMMSEKIRSKIICGVCFGINTVVLLYNAALGAYLAIIIGLILMFVFYWIRKGIKKAWPVLILIVCLTGLSFVVNHHRIISDLGLFANQMGDAAEAIGSDDPESQETLDKIGSSRGILWRKTIDVILANPVMGIGTDNIQLYIGNDIPHNEYLQIGANLGFPGLAMYLSALATLAIGLIKNLKKISDGIVLSFIALIVYCASAFVGISIPVAAFQLFLFLGLLNGWFRCRDDETMNKEIMEEMIANENKE